MELFLAVVVLMSAFKNKSNSLRTIEAQIAQKLKNNEAQPKFTGFYEKKSVYDGDRTRESVKRKRGEIKPRRSMFLKLDRNTSDTVLFLLEYSFRKLILSGETGTNQSSNL